MNNTVKKLLLVGLAVAFCATAFDLAAMKQGAVQSDDDLFEDVEEDIDLQQPVAQAPQDLQAAAQQNNQQFEARITQVEQQLANNNVNSVQVRQDIAQHTQEFTQLRQELDKLVQANKSLNRKIKYMFIAGLGLVVIVVVVGVSLCLMRPQISSVSASSPVLVPVPCVPAMPLCSARGNVTLGPVQEFIIGISKAKQWLFTCRPFSWL
jgi:hypothetical protein